MKKFSLTIATPCHENWDAMKPEEQGRFCLSCQKTVVDFTGMTDRQLAQFFKQPQAETCGRFYADQLDRTIELPKKRIPWLKYFFTISLPAFLLTLKAQGQRLPRLRVPQQHEILKGDTVVVPSGDATVHRTLGRVDMAAERRQCRKEKVEPAEQEVMGMPVKYVVTHYKASPIETTLPAAQPVQVKPVLQETYATHNDVSDADKWLNVRLGGVTLAKPALTKAQVSPRFMPAKNGTLLSAFQLSPNPAAAGSSVTVNIKSLETGRYAIDILTSSGQVVQSHEMMLTKSAPASLPLQKLAAAPYFVRLTNKTSGKRFTEILVVQ